MEAERRPRGIGENREAAHVPRDVGRPVVDLAAELLRLLRRGVDVVRRQVRIPVRRRSLTFRDRHATGDLGLTRLEERVRPAAHIRVVAVPAEDLPVEALRGVDVVRVELVPGEDALGNCRVAAGGRLEGRDHRALRVADNQDLADLGDVNRAVEDGPAGPLSALAGRVQIVDDDVAEPVRGCTPLGLAEPAVLRALRRDHRVVHLARLPHLDVPAEQLRVEALRRLEVGRAEVVPDEATDRSLHLRRHTYLLRRLICLTLARMTYPPRSYLERIAEHAD